MTHTATYTAASIEAAEKIAAHFGMSESFVRPGTMTANYRGRTVERMSDGVEFTLYASNADHDLFEQEFNSINRDMTPAASKTDAEAAPATEKQAAYLNTLIMRDPGAAMTIGASLDGARVAPGLSKSQASRLIELLKSEV